MDTNEDALLKRAEAMFLETAQRCRDSAEKHSRNEMNYAKGVVPQIEIRFPGVSLRHPSRNGYWLLKAECYESAAQMIRERVWEDGH